MAYKFVDIADIKLFCYFLFIERKNSKIYSFRDIFPHSGTVPGNPGHLVTLFGSGWRPLSQVGSGIDNDNLRHPALRAVRLTRSNAGHVTREGRVNGSRLFCSIFYF